MKVKNLKLKVKSWRRLRGLSLFLLFTLHFSLFTLFGCGYHIVGSKLIPFNSVTIKQVENKTYEPRLEERLHNALSEEFINQGIEVKIEGGDVEMFATVLSYQLGSIGAVDDRIKEQSIIMKAGFKLVDSEGVIEFKSVESPIKITYQTTGTVTESVAQKERATDKACNEIAKEIVSRIILKYAK